VIHQQPCKEILGANSIFWVEEGGTCLRYYAYRKMIAVSF